MELSFFVRFILYGWNDHFSSWFDVDFIITCLFPLVLMWSVSCWGSTIQPVRFLVFFQLRLPNFCNGGNLLHREVGDSASIVMSPILLFTWPLVTPSLLGLWLPSPLWLPLLDHSYSHTFIVPVRFFLNGAWIVLVLVLNVSERSSILTGISPSCTCQWTWFLAVHPLPDQVLTLRSPISMINKMTPITLIAYFVAALNFRCSRRSVRHVHCDLK